MPLPPQVPVIILQSPQPGDRLLVELYNRELPSYEQLPYGANHPDAGRYPNFRLVKEEPYGGSGDEKWVRRYWIDDPDNENTYNLAKQEFDGEDNTVPVYTRTYLKRRSEYSPAPKLITTLTGVLYVKITAGGSGYDQTTTAVATGGGGSGTTVVPIVFRGAVVGVYVSAEGQNHTTAPIIQFSGTGTGAAATAILQHPSAQLVAEQVLRIEGEPDDGLYWKITRIFHVLPGAILTTFAAAPGGKLRRTRRQKVALPQYPYPSGVNVISERIEAISVVMGLKETVDWTNSDGTTSGDPVPWLEHRETLEPENVELVTRIKTVPASTEEPPIGRSYLVSAGDMGAGAVFGGRRRVPTFPTGIANAGEWEYAQSYVVHSEKRPIEDSPNFTLVVQTCPRPHARYEFPELTHQFPALLTFDTSASSSLTLVNGRLALRTDQGFVYISHRTRRVLGVLLRKYSVGLVSNLSQQYKLYAPGAGSAFFGQIDQNTIYADLNAMETTVKLASSSGLVEVFPFSTLSGCSPASNSSPGTDDDIARGTLPVFYRLTVEQKLWKGNIYVREYLCVAEDRDIVADAQALRFSGTDENDTTGASNATNAQYLYCR